MDSKITLTTNVDKVKETLAQAGSNLVVIHFAADWAPQCVQMYNVVEELSKDVEIGSAVFIQVDAEAVAEISQKYEISSVPTFVLIKNGAVLGKINGANAPKLTSEVKKFAADNSLPLISPLSLADKHEDINSRLKKLTNLAKCMVFMKGNPTEPKCGFSRQLISILNELNADYNTFDILTDEEVRQGLKEFSKWPTYPQVYVNGELIGGLDIIKELQQQGELEPMLPRKTSLEERLKLLINKADIMVFMKGDKVQQKCGFSKQLIAILNETGLPYETFDILEDEEVRQGLKTFSNWPTYPQVYGKGNLIGGLDIIKELLATGELVTTLKS